MTILELIKSDGFYTKKKASTNGGEFAGPCPWCRGDDRFLCWPEQGEFGRYYCRKCGKSGDAVEYLRTYRRFTFPEACAYLGKEINHPSSTLAGSRPARPQWEPRTTAAPNDLWQAKARKLVDDSVHNLWGPYGTLALDFLIKKRGLTEATIKEFSLGCILLDQWEPAPEWGLEEVLKDDGKAKKLWFPRGHVIPLCTGDQVLRVRIRRPKSAGDPRYYLQRGSDTRAMILGIDKPVSIIVESELDALLLHQEGGDLVNVISLGNAQARPDQETADLLKQSQLILVALDADPSGAKESWQWWAAHYPMAHRWPSIRGKDPGEMWAAGVNIRTWIEAALMEYDADTQPEPRLNLAAVDGEHVIDEYHGPAPPSSLATCESCPWYELNPWIRDPALGAWCHRQMEHLVVGSTACEEFNRGEVPLRQPHKQVPAATGPAPQEHILTCFDCPMHEHDPINPPEGWGRCTFKGKWCYGLRVACKDISGTVQSQEDVSLKKG